MLPAAWKGAGLRRSGEGRPERIRERVHDQLVAAHRGGLEEGQALERPLEPVRLGADDPLAVDREPDECPASVT